MPRSRARFRGATPRGRSRGVLVGGASRMPAQLQQAYLTGKVAPRIGWGSPGSFRRCLAQAGAHGVPKRMRGGMCQNLYIKATGRAAGRHGGKRR